MPVSNLSHDAGIESEALEKSAFARTVPVRANAINIDVIARPTRDARSIRNKRSKCMASGSKHDRRCCQYAAKQKTMGAPRLRARIGKKEHDRRETPAHVLVAPATIGSKHGDTRFEHTRRRLDFRARFYGPTHLTSKL